MLGHPPQSSPFTIIVLPASAPESEKPIISPMYMPDTMNGIMKVFSLRGTQIGKKWKTAGKVALSKKPIMTRINRAMP